jgi:Ca2+-binding EF-hand superfamily protein
MFFSCIGMFDTDGNGVIDFNEFAALWQYVCDWQETFRSFDMDNSGTIDRNELKLGILYHVEYVI